MHAVSEDSGVSSCFPSLTPSSSVCGGFRLYDLVGDQVLGVGLWAAERRSLTLCNRHSTFPSYTELKTDSFIYIFFYNHFELVYMKRAIHKRFHDNFTLTETLQLFITNSIYIHRKLWNLFMHTRLMKTDFSWNNTELTPQTSSELSSFSLSLLWGAAGRPGTEFKLKTMRDVSTRARRHLSACLHLQEDDSKCDTLTL